MAETPLQLTPSFDGRAVCYPTDALLRDYLAWRQVDTHVNNQVGLLCTLGCTLAASASLSLVQLTSSSSLVAWSHLAQPRLYYGTICI